LFGALWSVSIPGGAARDAVRRVTLLQIFFTGFQGLPFITATALVIGATMVIQTAASAPGLPGEILGKILVAVVLRELAPLTTAIIIASRSGTAIATELGNMQANLELQGLASLGIDPLRYVVFPRITGVVVSVLVLTVYFSVLAITGSVIVALTLGASPAAIHSGVAQAIRVEDFVLYVVKGVGCGVIVGWMCCFFGLQVKSSPTEVPLNSARAVVRSVLGCVVFSFAVTVAYYGWVGTPAR
jgi:phospholipid/cholesterol/gamma-HCH transport system permease protein